jgi:hypothetical protein
MVNSPLKTAENYLRNGKNPAKQGFPGCLTGKTGNQDNKKAAGLSAPPPSFWVSSP